RRGSKPKRRRTPSGQQAAALSLGDEARVGEGSEAIVQALRPALQRQRFGSRRNGDVELLGGSKAANDGLFPDDPIIHKDGERAGNLVAAAYNGHEFFVVWFERERDAAVAGQAVATAEALPQEANRLSWSRLGNGVFERLRLIALYHCERLDR